MLAQAKRKFDRILFNWLCRGVYKTPAIQCDPHSDVLIISQLYHPDLTMYMLAAKSFAQYVKPKGFLIVDDGLSPEDRTILKAHFGQVRFVSSRSVHLAGCPAGGCWERLLTLSEENKANYVIQLDSDTLTLAEPREVLQCVAEGRGFTLGTSSGTHLVSFDEASQYAHTHTHPHVQNHAERAFAEYPGKEGLKYVRGCAGFTGFPRGWLARTKIEAFSTQMEKLVGKEKWLEWGSEQVTSNFMAANAPDPLVLPVDRYPFWAPGVDIAGSALIHFFGTYRFSKGMYLRQARRLIDKMDK